MGVCKKSHVCRHCGRDDKAAIVHLGRHSKWTAHYRCAKRAEMARTAVKASKTGG